MTVGSIDIPRQVEVSGEVADALRQRQPFVALETTILTHGLPRPDNLRVAREMEAAVRAAGAVPATIGVLNGRVHIGLDDAQLQYLAFADSVHKLSTRDLPVAAVLGLDGATTVASTAAIATRAGICVFATGGLGGVHRGDTEDESADLLALSRSPIVVVCAGVKSILDVSATLERLETYGVTVVGYRTGSFPGFYLTDSGHRVPWRVDSPEQVAALLAARRHMEVDDAAVVVANPVPTAYQLDPHLHDATLADGLAMARRAGVTGKEVTPFLLAHFHAATDGASLAVNRHIAVANAELAAQIAVAHAMATR